MPRPPNATPHPAPLHSVSPAPSRSSLAVLELSEGHGWEADCRALWLILQACAPIERGGGGGLSSNKGNLRCPALWWSHIARPPSRRTPESENFEIMWPWKCCSANEFHQEPPWRFQMLLAVSSKPLQYDANEFHVGRIGRTGKKTHVNTLFALFQAGFHPNG